MDWLDKDRDGEIDFKEYSQRVTHLTKALYTKTKGKGKGNEDGQED